jgi:hypothetical protein
MWVLEALALIVVVLAATFLVLLGLAGLFVPAVASRFLLGFASTRALHLAEMACRLACGVAFVRHAPSMAAAAVFGAFGWLLIVTTACLLAVPWQWHQRFAHRAAPLFTRWVGWIGAGALALGVAIFVAVVRGRGA